MLVDLESETLPPLSLLPLEGWGSPTADPGWEAAGGAARAAEVGPVENAVEFGDAVEVSPIENAVDSGRPKAAK